MMEIIFILIILIIIGAVGYYAFQLLCKNKTRENYIFFSVVLLFFLVVYCVSVLKYRITGSAIGVEKATEQINTAKDKAIEQINAEVSKIAANVTLERKKVEKLEGTIQSLAATVTKLSGVGSASAKKDDGKRASQYAEELKMYQNQVVEQLPLNLRQEVNAALMKFESKDVEPLHEK